MLYYGCVQKWRDRQVEHLILMDTVLAVQLDESAFDAPVETRIIIIAVNIVKAVCKSAKIAGLNVPGSGMQGAVAFLETVSDQYGKCRYKPEWQSPGTTMTSVGMLCRLFAGARPTDAQVVGGANFLLQNLPVWGENGINVDMYYWYYGTMSMFQVGGTSWKKWNTALRDMLCDNQRRGKVRDGSAQDVDGSWDPVGKWAVRGGRAYATATGALCLEVYYRYLPLYRQ